MDGVKDPSSDEESFWMNTQQYVERRWKSRDDPPPSTPGEEEHRYPEFEEDGDFDEISLSMADWTGSNRSFQPLVGWKESMEKEQEDQESTVETLAAVKEHEVSEHDRSLLARDDPPCPNQGSGSRVNPQETIGGWGDSKAKTTQEAKTTWRCPGQRMTGGMKGLCPL